MNDLAGKILELVERAEPVSALQAHLERRESVVLKGVAGSLKSVLMASLWRRGSSQILYITADLQEAENVREDLELFAGEECVQIFTSETRRGLDLQRTTTQGEIARLSTLEALAESRPTVVVAHISGLDVPLPAPQKYRAEQFTVSVGDSLDFEGFVARLVDLGFVREERVEQPGQLSVRGGIVDFFPLSAPAPYRVEFWGDEVESLREFDPVSQRSTTPQESVTVFSQDLAVVSESAEYDLLDYLRDPALVVLDEPAQLRKALAPTLSVAEPEDEEWGVSNPEWERLEARLASFQQLHFSSFAEPGGHTLDFHARRQEALHGNLKLLRETFARCNEELQRDGDPPHLFFLCEYPHQAERMTEIFEDEQVAPDNLTVATLGLHQGFVFPQARLAIFTDHEFYGRARLLRLPKRASKGLTPKEFRTLRPGDYVVHVDHGIGVFRGLKKITVNGHERECLHLEYKGGDNLYVRFERMDRVHKYASREGMKPTLNKLGSTEWQRLKRRTKKRIKDIANELIELYAKRKAQPGFAFSSDTVWQQELEASFPYEDTPDQVRATYEVKRDMESRKPMDRLVCGDVGFGKTEIAVRAAFKCVLSGKQVAMLVPTTILAYQHHQTFRQRLQNFPVKVEMLSRFRSRAEQKAIVEQVKSGEVDILIGTHRVLSKDVDFKDLGLLIVDEEQRFGVRQKERLKALRANVDVLTLTATPIPRTLHMALMGARDITNINTPPKNRLPIVTEVLPFNKAYIREAILRELERGGQVFFVHNRVQTIDRIATMLSGLVPEANFVVAHGQMPEHELEKVMIAFLEKRYDVLVSTAIIESGLDMPNVNTIIINRADKFGLAQLYQLRGRVGRSSQRAYAYLLIPAVETLTDDALKRLRAIEEFAELGSGSQLAMRDLEIRGAGNLLGAEQSGFIDALGFDLYNKILQEAVSELKQEETETTPEVDTRVEIDTDAYLPEAYIGSSSERVEIYRRLIETTSLADLERQAQELRDRFGRFPEPVENLLNFLAIRLLGRRLGLTTLRVSDHKMVGIFSPSVYESAGEPFKRWLGTMVERANMPFEFTQNDGLGIRLSLEDVNGDKLLIIKDFMQSLIPKD